MRSINVRYLLTYFYLLTYTVTRHVAYLFLERLYPLLGGLLSLSQLQQFFDVVTVVVAVDKSFQFPDHMFLLFINTF